jgi:hypothetical protein
MKNVRTPGVPAKVLPRDFRIVRQEPNHVGYLAGSASEMWTLNSVVTRIGKEAVVTDLRPLFQRPSGGAPLDFTIQLLLFVTRSCYVCWRTADDTNMPIRLQMAAYLMLRL